MIKTTWWYTGLLLTALLMGGQGWGITPMGTAEKVDVMICSMTEFNDSGPRHPCVVAWYQLESDGTVVDYRTVYRTDDDIMGLAVGDLNGNGEHELIAAVRGQRTGSSSIMIAAVDRMGMLKGKLRAITEPEDCSYRGLALGEFDSDGLPDILALRRGEGDDSELVWLDIDGSGKVVESKRLESGRLRGAEAVTLGGPRQDGAVGVLVALSSSEENRIVRLRYAFGIDGPDLVGRQDVAPISKSLGDVHGLTITELDGRPTLLAATRRVATEPLGTGLFRAMEHEGVFVAPLATEDAAGDDRSCFVRVPIDRRGRGAEVTTIDELRTGRQWAGALAVIPALPAAKAPTVAPEARRTNTPRKILLVGGLVSSYFRVDALGQEADDITVVRRTVKRFKNLHMPPAAEFKNLAELLRYDTVVLADVPIWALRYHQVLLLEPYVRSGGQLVLLEGPCSGGAGGYVGSPLEDVLPCAAGPAFATRKLQQPWALPPAGAGTTKERASGYVYYCKLQGPLRADSTILLAADEQPMLMERRLGHGRVLLFAGMPLGQDSDAEPGFWRCQGWPDYLKQLLFP